MCASSSFFAMSTWFILAPAALAETPQEEIARLKAEVARLQAENLKLREAVGDLMKGREPETPQLDVYRPEPGMNDDRGKVIFSWKAQGKFLPERPVSLFWAEKRNGPWNLIVNQLAQKGTFAWRRPANVPPSVFLRLHVRDALGQEVLADSPNLVPIEFPMEKKP